MSLLSFRELLEREQSQRLQQASVEEQIDTLRQSLQDQTSAAKSLTAGLEAQLEDMQNQINKVISARAGQILNELPFLSLQSPDSLAAKTHMFILVPAASVHQVYVHLKLIGRRWRSEVAEWV